MSCWVVSKAHIDCVVQAAVVEGLIPMSDRDKVGADLWRENYNSFAYRYSHHPEALEDIKIPLWESYKFRGVEAPLDDAIVLQQAQCYRYQSCEHPEFVGSEAEALTSSLTSALEGRGVEPAGPWGITEIEQALLLTTEEKP